MNLPSRSARVVAETAVTSVLGHMAPDEAIPVMRKPGIPVVDDDVSPEPVP